MTKGGGGSTREIIENSFFRETFENFEAGVIFKGRWDSIENWHKPKIKPELQSLTKLGLSKSVRGSIDRWQSKTIIF